MEEKNSQSTKDSSLGDIVLDKGYVDGGNKKLLLAVGVLSLILIIVVVFMRLSSDEVADVNQNKLPPEPTKVMANDPLFEPVAIDDFSNENKNLDKIAKKLKEESFADSKLNDGIVEEDFVVIEPVDEVPVDMKKAPQKAQAPVTKIQNDIQKVAQEVKNELEAPVLDEITVYTEPASKKIMTPVKTQSAPKAVSNGKYYIQVGSFAKYSPDKKFLKSINALGFDYSFHKVSVKGREMNKVLVGPFSSDKQARESIGAIRKNIEPSAFILKI